MLCTKLGERLETEGNNNYHHILHPTPNSLIPHTYPVEAAVPRVVLSTQGQATVNTDLPRVTRGKRPSARTKRSGRRGGDVVEGGAVLASSRRVPWSIGCGALRLTPSETTTASRHQPGPRGHGEAGVFWKLGHSFQHRIGTAPARRVIAESVFKGEFIFLILF